MSGVLTAPMPSHSLKETPGAGLGWGQRRNQRNDFPTRFAGRASRDGSCQCSHVLDQRPVFEGGMQAGADADRARFDASPMKIERRILDEGGMRISTRESQVGRQGGLVVCGGENALHERFLGRKSIGGADPSSEWHTGEEHLGKGDLLRLFRHRDVAERFLALMRAKGEHVGSRLFVCSGSTHGCRPRQSDPLVEPLACCVSSR